ncbi:hypothetical protein [Siminovitchia terrae]|uniref:hypothetical protein n=1 Tax=Siminovitchia terrae TaxID=1914933 RepID=UPI00163C34B9|nr:hypothetical protein [Siminovitchia terrae]
MSKKWIFSRQAFFHLGKYCSFLFIQQKSPTSVSGEMNAYWYSIQWGFKPR